MEKEPNLHIQTKPENLESRLRKKGWYIERMQLSEKEPIQCETCMEEGFFGFHDEAWFIEGKAYCQKHKEGALQMLEKIDTDAEKRELEEKNLDEDERAMQRLLIEAYGREKTFWKEEKRIRKSEPGISLGEIIKKLYAELEEEQGKKE